MAHSGADYGNETFMHEALPEPATHFRLMKLCHSASEEDEQEVHIEMSAFAIDNAHPYAAISYSWGDQTDRTDILINGRAHRVGLNSWYALLQMKYHHEECFLWMDAICINQINAYEKGLQVELMGSIFKNAFRVNICVGPHAGDSEFLVEQVRWYAQLSSEALNQEPVASDTGENEKIKSRKNLLRTLPKEVIARVVASTRLFSLRPYFSRLWITQEVSLAKDRSFYCGTSLFSWRTLSTLHDDMCTLPSELQKEPAYEWPSLFFVWLFDRHGVGRDADLFTQVVFWRLFQCFDARDRVYGLLSLHEPRDQESAIRPNYLTSPFKLLLNMLTSTHMQSISPDGEPLFHIDDFYHLAESLRIVSKTKEVVTALKHRHWNITRNTGHLSRTQISHQVPEQMSQVRVLMGYSVVLSRGMAKDLCAPLVLGKEPLAGDSQWSEIDLVFEQARSASATSRQILYNQGLEVALLPHHAASGDILLAHSNPPRHPNSDNPLGGETCQPCLLIRATDNPRLFAIVGQAIYNPRMVLCLSADECSVCDVSPFYHCHEWGHYDQKGIHRGLSWIMHFDPEDLAVFPSQDQYHEEIPETMEHPPGLVTSNLPLEALNRLQTGVTRTPGSSFVTYNGTTEALARLHAVIASARESGKESEIGGTSQSKFGQTRRHSW